MVQTRTEEIKAVIDSLRNDYLAILEIFTEWGEQFAELRALISDEQHRLDAAPLLEDLQLDRRSPLTDAGDERQRARALKRRPRAQTDEEVRKLMLEHRAEWLSAAELASIVAGDSDQELFDYLRASYGKSLREGLNVYYEVRKKTGRHPIYEVGWIEQFRYKERP